MDPEAARAPYARGDELSSVKLWAAEVDFCRWKRATPAPPTDGGFWNEVETVTRNFSKHLQLAVTFALVVVSVASSQTANDVPERLLPSACTALQGLAIPASAIGLPTSGAVVQTAVAVGASDAGNANGDFCKVTGIVKPQHAGSPNLEFEVNLPLAWNRRALQMGGGGYDGIARDRPRAVHAAAGEHGHAAQAGLRHARQRRRPQRRAPGSTARFAMDDEALVNYGKQSVKKAHDAAMAVIRKAYGRAPRALLLHRRLAGRARGARRRRALSRGLRRRRRALSGLQRDDAPSRIAQRRQGAVRGRRRGVDQPEEDEADRRRGLREVRRPRRRQGRHHQQRRRLQRRVRREDAALRRTAPTPATPACPTRSSRPWRRSRRTTSPDSRSPAWTRSRNGRCSRARRSRARRTSGRCRSRRIRCRARSRCSTAPAIRRSSSSSRATRSSTR